MVRVHGKIIALFLIDCSSEILPTLHDDNLCQALHFKFQGGSGDKKMTLTVEGYFVDWSSRVHILIDCHIYTHDAEGNALGKG